LLLPHPPSLKEASLTGAPNLRTRIDDRNRLMRDDADDDSHSSEADFV
jgi:hypothetical protein